MATLEEQYSNSTNEFFRNKLIMALAKKLGTELNGIAPGDPDNKYGRYIMLARKALNDDQTGMTFVARIVAAFDLHNGSTDPEIQTAIDNNFDRLSKMFDNDVG